MNNFLKSNIIAILGTFDEMNIQSFIIHLSLRSQSYMKRESNF